MFYDRKIKYLEDRKDGERIRTAGFVKVEVREELCRMSIHVAGLHSTDTFEKNVFVLGGGREGKLCKIKITGGRGDSGELSLHSGHLSEAGISYKELEEIRIPLAAGRELRCLWVNQTVLDSREKETDKEAGIEKTVADERGKGSRNLLGASTESQMPEKSEKIWMQEENAESRMQEASTENQILEKNEESRVAKADAGSRWQGENASNQMPKANLKSQLQEASTENQMPEENSESQVAEESMENRMQEENAESRMSEERVTENLAEGITKESGKGNVANSQSAIQKESNIRKGKDSTEGFEIRHESKNLSEEGTESRVQKGSTAKNPSREMNTTEEAVSAPVRRPPLEDKWRQISAIYPRVAPFGDEKEYISIGPEDFVIFPAKYYQLVNNSFLLHGYHNYGHLILIRIERRGEIRYYVGVPGIYHEKEKQVAIMFGFESFESKTEPVQSGDYGYYMIRIEL